MLPDIISVAVFDTSFHTIIPKTNYLYSLPQKYYTNYSVRKYGAYGISHRFVSEIAAKMLNTPLDGIKIITYHIGNRVSIEAIQDGKSIDTSMGFTLLAGVTTGTRSGDIDVSLIPYVMEKENITDINKVIEIFNRESRLLGIY